MNDGAYDRGHSPRVRIAIGVLAILLFRGTAVQAEEAQPSPRYLALRAGLTTEEFSPTGWWLDIGVLKHWPMSPLWYATAEAAIAASRDTTSWTLTYHTYNIRETSHNRRFLFGIPLRAGLGIGPGVFGVEFGVVAGAAFSSLKSDICENQSALKPMLGGYAGPVLRVGSERAIRIAAQFQMVSPIMPRCSNSGTPHWFSDSPPNPAIVTQLGLVW